MASEESREELRRNRKAAAELAKNAQPAAASGSVKFKAKPKPEPSELEDPAKQDEILDPPTLSTTVGGEPFELHELSAKQARRFAGFIRGAAFDLFQERKPNDSVRFTELLTALIAKDHEDEFLTFIARASKPPFEVKDAEVPEIAGKISEALRYDELMGLLVVILTQNKTLESLTPRAPAKNG